MLGSVIVVLPGFPMNPLSPGGPVTPGGPLSPSLPGSPGSPDIEARYIVKIQSLMFITEIGSLCFTDNCLPGGPWEPDDPSKPSDPGGPEGPLSPISPVRPLGPDQESEVNERLGLYVNIGFRIEFSKGSSTNWL